MRAGVTGGIFFMVHDVVIRTEGREVRVAGLRGRRTGDEEQETNEECE
jgi:hypothetical protein